MAATITCDMCEREPARMMQSDLTDGSTVAVGQNCLFVYFYNAAMGLAPEPEPEPEPEPIPVDEPVKRTRKPRKVTTPKEESDYVAELAIEAAVPDDAPDNEPPF